MALYEYFLKALGLRGAISQKIIDLNSPTQKHNIEINVDKKFNIEKNIVGLNRSFYEKIYFRMPFNLIYFMIVLIILLTPCIYTIARTFYQLEVKYITSNLFTFLFVIQYLIGYYYYQTTHFGKTMRRYEKYNKYILIAFVICTIITILINIGAVLFLIYGINITLFSEVYNYFDIYGKVIIAITMSIIKLYSYGLLLSNLIIFSSVFICCSLEIKKFASKLEQFILNNEEGLTIDSITKEHAEKKTHYSNLVSNLNMMFSTITACGIIGSYFVIVNYETNFVGIFHYVDIVLFVIIEIIYLFSINRVKNSISSIQSIVGSENMIDRYLSRTNLEQIAGDNMITDVMDTTNIVNDNNIKQIKKSNKTILIEAIKESKNIDHDDINREINDISESHNVIDGVNPQQDKNYINKYMIPNNMNKKLNYIRDLGMRTMIRSHENAEGIDWLILNRKLGESWDNFNIFGFDIEDTKIIEKVIVVVLFFIGMTSLDKRLGF